MNRLKSILGYAWAVAAVILSLATFMGNDAFSRVLASVTALTVSPRFTGGEIVRTIDHGAYRTNIHRPVFDSLIGETKEGFVQLAWSPAAGLPPVIREQIDYDGDGIGDFTITMDTKTGAAELEPGNSSVLPGPRTYRLRDGWAARIALRRQP